MEKHAIMHVGIMSKLGIFYQKVFPSYEYMKRFQIYQDVRNFLLDIYLYYAVLYCVQQKSYLHMVCHYINSTCKIFKTM